MLTSIIIGLIAGWLAGMIYKGSGFGIIGNIVIGLIGAVVGNFLASMLGVSSENLLGNITTATIGAVILLFAVNAFTMQRGQRLQ
jgi:uncharacterized membrane protein YeaQ/YmgE (transglycosylase-associated protein family)